MTRAKLNDADVRELKEHMTKLLHGSRREDWRERVLDCALLIPLDGSQEAADLKEWLAAIARDIANALGER